MNRTPMSTIGRAGWLQSMPGRRWLDKPARDAIPDFGDAPDNSRYPASDESKKLI
jgi:hypothetical protein